MTLRATVVLGTLAATALASGPALTGAVQRPAQPQRRERVAPQPQRRIEQQRIQQEMLERLKRAELVQYTAVRRVQRALATAVQAGNVRQAAALYAEDAIVVPWGGIPVEGREAFAAWLQGALERDRFELSPDPEGLIVEGSWAVYQASYIRINRAAPDKPRSLGQSLAVLRRGQQGWRIVRQMWSAGQQMALTSLRPEEIPVPQFPWPPPEWTTRHVLPVQLVSDGRRARLADVFDRLQEALRRAGIPETSVYAIGADGFAIVTRPESIRDDGTPQPDRWAVDAAPPRFAGLIAYLKALFTGVPGRFRVIVLSVTERPITPGEEPPSEEELTELFKSGAGTLPPELRDVEIDVKCEALIYEYFARTENEPAVLVESSRLTSVRHLSGAGLWSAQELLR